MTPMEKLFNETLERLRARGVTPVVYRLKIQPNTIRIGDEEEFRFYQELGFHPKRDRLRKSDTAVGVNI